MNEIIKPRAVGTYITSFTGTVGTVNADISQKE